MDGNATATIDLASGHYVERQRSGLSRSAQGFDGSTPWMQDLSGFSSPQEGGNKPALAVNRAYRNANVWWRAGRGGAQVKPVSCGTIEVTPQRSQPFRATFDPSTHLLAVVREQQTFGHIQETHYADYRRCGSALVPGRIEVISDGNPATTQTFELDKCKLAPAQAKTAYTMPVGEPDDWSLPPGGRAIVPMRARDTEVMIMARINGKGPFLFYLDSGGHNILSPRLARELGIAVEGRGQSGGAGEKTVESGYAGIASVDAGGAILKNQTFAVIETSPPDVVGELIGGILGVEYFERFVTRIDYEKNLVTFEDPRRFDSAERSTAGTPVAFTFYEHMPQVAGHLEELPIRFNIDTGASDTLTLTSPFVEREKLRSRFTAAVHLVTGWGTGGPSYGWLARARSLRLGPAVVKRPLVSLSTAKAGSFSDPNYGGNIGNGALRHFRVTFDYPDKKLYLLKVPRPNLDAANFDRTGMRLNLGKGGLQVMDVGANTPAAEAGIRAGDIVTRIGDVDLNSETLRDTRWLQKQLPVGKPVTVVFTRNGAASAVMLVPRELVPR